MDVPAAVESVVTTARAERPDLTIVARARDSLHAAKLYELQVTDAVPETVEASLQLSEALLIDIGMPMGLVIASVHEKRDEFRRALQPPAPQARERRAIRVVRRPAPGTAARSVEPKATAPEQEEASEDATATPRAAKRTEQR